MCSMNREPSKTTTCSYLKAVSIQRFIKCLLHQEPFICTVGCVANRLSGRVVKVVLLRRFAHVGETNS